VEYQAEILVRAPGDVPGKMMTTIHRSQFLKTGKAFGINPEIHKIATQFTINTYEKILPFHLFT
jgi:hypothetical protein